MRLVLCAVVLLSLTACDTNDIRGAIGVKPIPENDTTDYRQMTADLLSGSYIAFIIEVEKQSAYFYRSNDSAEDVSDAVISACSPKINDLRNSLIDYFEVRESKGRAMNDVAELMPLYVGDGKLYAKQLLITNRIKATTPVERPVMRQPERPKKPEKLTM